MQLLRCSGCKGVASRVRQFTFPLRGTFYICEGNFNHHLNVLNGKYLHLTKYLNQSEYFKLLPITIVSELYI